MSQYFGIAERANFSFKKAAAKHHQLALGFVSGTRLVGGWMNPSPVLALGAKSA